MGVEDGPIQSRHCSPPDTGGHADNHYVLSVAFSPSGQVLASGSDDNTVRLWRVPDGALLRTLEGHTEQVWSVAFSPNGQVLALGSGDRTVGLWRVSNGTPYRVLWGHRYEVAKVAFSPDGQTLALGAMDRGTRGTVRLWRVTSGAPRSAGKTR